MTDGIDARRRAVVMLLTTTALTNSSAGESLAKFYSTANYLDKLRAALGLHIANTGAQQEIHRILKENSDLRHLMREASTTLETSIGSQWQTAEHTIPSLVLQDEVRGSLYEVGGLWLTPTELVLISSQEFSE